MYVHTTENCFSIVGTDCKVGVPRWVTGRRREDGRRRWGQHIWAPWWWQWRWYSTTAVFRCLKNCTFIQEPCWNEENIHKSDLIIWSELQCWIVKSVQDCPKWTYFNTLSPGPRVHSWISPNIRYGLGSRNLFAHPQDNVVFKLVKVNLGT